MEIVAAKMDHLRDLAPFAMDVGLRFMQDCRFADAEELHRLARAVIAGAGCLDDPGALRAACAALPPPDRAALEDRLAHSSLLQDRATATDAVQELDDALSLHWIGSFGLESEAEARVTLGDAGYKAVEALVARKADAFWERDALAERLNTAPMSAHDMAIAAAFGGLLADQPVLAIEEFVSAELLRADLAAGALRLPADAVSRMESGLNARRAHRRPDWPPVSLAEWLS